MTLRDAVLKALDAKADAVAPDAKAAAELFSVVDVLDAQPPLRRSLSDPSASPESREKLVNRLFAKQLQTGALRIVEDLVVTGGLSARQLADALERQAVRLLLRAAQRAGELNEVQRELYTFSNTVEQNPELDHALRNKSYPIKARRKLIADLTADRVLATTTQLLERAAAARKRTLQLTVGSYLEMAAGLAGEQIAHVRVAKPLDAKRVDRLREALEASTGSPVSLQIAVDPTVLGGMDVRIGDHIIESTVAGRLDEARRLLNTH